MATILPQPSKRIFAQQFSVHLLPTLFVVTPTRQVSTDQEYVWICFRSTMFGRHNVSQTFLIPFSHLPQTRLTLWQLWRPSWSHYLQRVSPSNDSRMCQGFHASAKQTNWCDDHLNNRRVKSLSCNSFSWGCASLSTPVVSEKVWSTNLCNPQPCVPHPWTTKFLFWNWNFPSPMFSPQRTNFTQINKDRIGKTQYLFEICMLFDRRERARPWIYSRRNVSGRLEIVQHYLVTNFEYVA